ncbi:serine/arginine repetitive matrix protein 3-like [Meles meles]|uniref:serine/arginine repetitive matrix protein 3-like n=1 Tax=Meles meles TaxID=9662 RepID=UPI001E69E65E|nr:serine/arginine repetitive matrix protein 3-like [Meles meles]
MVSRRLTGGKGERTQASRLLVPHCPARGCGRSQQPGLPGAPCLCVRGFSRVSASAPPSPAGNNSRRLPRAARRSRGTKAALGPRHHVTRALAPRSPGPRQGAASRAREPRGRGWAAEIHLARFRRDKRGSSYFRASPGQLGADQKPQAEETQARGVSAHGGCDPPPQALLCEAGHPLAPGPSCRLPARPPTTCGPRPFQEAGSARPGRTVTRYPSSQPPPPTSPASSLSSHPQRHSTPRNGQLHLSQGRTRKIPMGQKVFADTKNFKKIPKGLDFKEETELVSFSYLPGGVICVGRSRVTPGLNLELNLSAI